jgi:hypothetical protein
VWCNSEAILFGQPDLGRSWLGVLPCRSSLGAGAELLDWDADADLIWPGTELLDGDGVLAT